MEDYLSEFLFCFSLLEYFPLRVYKMRVCYLISKDSPPNATSFSKLSLIAVCSWSKYFRSLWYSPPAGSVFHTSKADRSLSLKDSMSSSTRKSGTWKPEISLSYKSCLSPAEIFPWVTHFLPQFVTPRCFKVYLSPLVLLCLKIVLIWNRKLAVELRKDKCFKIYF